MKSKEEQIKDLIQRCQKEIDTVPEVPADYYGDGLSNFKATERQKVYNDIVKKYAAMMEETEKEKP